MSGPRFAIGAGSDVGRGRPANEDTYLIDDEHRLYAVADGMGGHRAGEVASATAVETLVDSFTAGRPLGEAVADANAAVYAKAESNLEMRGMGTTLTALSLIDDNRAVLAHVGDSRAYLARDGGVTQVTEDHSLVEQLLREGRISPEEALNHPQRAIITRALGVDPEVEVDLYDLDLRAGDRVLLCSDGLTNMVGDDAIAAVLDRQGDPQQAVATLIDMANSAGGDDNITAVLLDVQGGVQAAGPAASRTMAGASFPDEPTGEWTAFHDEGTERLDPAGTKGESDDAPAGLITPPPAAVPEAAGVPPASRTRGPKPARRLLVWVLPILLIVGGGLGAVGWYARRTFYVGLSGEQVILFRGVPGGLLGWDPTVEDTSPLQAGDLTPAERADLEEGHRFSSRSKATRFLERLEAKSGASAAGESNEPDIGTASTTTTRP